MIATSDMILMQIYLVCLMAVGVITVKVRMVDDHSRSVLTELILNIFLPCTILASFFGTSRDLLPTLGIVVVISLGIMALSYVLSLLFYRKADTEQKKVLLYGTLISMASFLGNPVIESLYGPAALTYVAAYLVPLRAALWAFGVIIFTGGKLNPVKAFLHPCFLATYIGVVIMITGYKPPALVVRIVSNLGSCSTPISMLVIGNVLGLMDPRKIFTKLSALYAFIRLIFIPLITLGILLLVRLDPLITGISVILAGMPSGVTVSMLAAKYNSDKELATQITFVSIVLSIFTAPALAWFVNRAL